jgi:hypothetical protein
MEDDVMNEDQELLVSYQFGERIKAALIIGSKLLLVLESLRGEELAGAKKLMLTFLDALDTEIWLAVHATGRREFTVLNEKLELIRTGIVAEEFSAALEAFSSAVTQATTTCAITSSAMAERGLL